MLNAQKPKVKSIRIVNELAIDVEEVNMIDSLLLLDSKIDKNGELQE